jgi:hypothetical protein
LWHIQFENEHSVLAYFGASVSQVFELHVLNADDIVEAATFRTNTAFARGAAPQALHAHNETHTCRNDMSPEFRRAVGCRRLREGSGGAVEFDAGVLLWMN